YAEGRFGLPDASKPEFTAPHEVGPLHLRQVGSYDTLAGAESLLGVTDLALEHSPSLALAGGVAVLAELGARTGARPGDIATWAEAVAQYSGLSDRVSQVVYVRQVWSVLHEGTRATA